MTRLGRRVKWAIFAGTMALATTAGSITPALASTTGWYITGDFGELRCYNQVTSDGRVGATCNVRSGYLTYWRVEQDCSWGGTYYSIWALQDGEDGNRSLWGPTTCTWGINSITVQYHY